MVRGPALAEQEGRLMTVDRSGELAEWYSEEDADGAGKHAVPGSRNGGAEPGTDVHAAAVPGSRNRSGTVESEVDPAVPGSQPSMREPGTTDEQALYVDISALIDGTVPEPPEPVLGKRTDGHCLFYGGQVNWVFGDPEAGKSWLCLVCVVEALSAGRRVLIIDLDHNGAPATVHRLIALGAPIAALRNPGLFRYCEPEDRVELRQVVDDSKTWRPAVAIVDSIGELLPMYGSNSNSADEFTTVHSNVLKPLAKAGAAVLAVDHLAKSADSRAAGPGGTAAKRRAIGGVSLRVKVKKPFTPGHGGSATLVVNKDRHGGLRAHCPVGDREPVAGTFRLLAFNDGVLEWSITPPADGERNDDEAAPPEDIAAIASLDPPPETVEDARQRLKWQKQRTANALRSWREQAPEGTRR
ncbi:recombinase RecA [Mycolicibacterium sp. XJ662]